MLNDPETLSIEISAGELFRISRSTITSSPYRYDGCENLNFAKTIKSGDKFGT